VILLFSSQLSFAQGDWARTMLGGPIGVTEVILKMMGLNKNITPANILVDDADLQINAFPITVIHNFNIGNRFAQVVVNVMHANVTGSFFAPALGSQIITPLVPNTS